MSQTNDQRTVPLEEFQDKPLIYQTTNMNTISIVTGIFTCLLLMFTLAHSFSLSGKTNNDEHQVLLERPSPYSPGKYLSMYQDGGPIIDISDEDEEHDLEKRRFNAWAGKRGIPAKRRFNAWAGRR